MGGYFPLDPLAKGKQEIFLVLLAGVTRHNRLGDDLLMPVPQRTGEAFWHALQQIAASGRFQSLHGARFVARLPVRGVRREVPEMVKSVPERGILRD